MKPHILDHTMEVLKTNWGWDYESGQQWLMEIADMSPLEIDSSQIIPGKAKRPWLGQVPYKLDQMHKDTDTLEIIRNHEES